MPLSIINSDLYADRTVQDWHRAAFPASAWAIDLDLLGACNLCRCPVYLIEATTNPNKPLSILKKLAEVSSLPAFVIWHDTQTVTSGRQIYPKYVALPSQTHVATALISVRRQHYLQHHATKQQGR